MANEAFKAGEGALWLQPSGPNSTPQYLGCHAVGDIAEPKGDINLLYCPDEKATGRFKVDGSYQSAPGPVTTSLTTKLYQVADYLESLKCSVPLYVVKQKCGRRDVFGNFDRIFIFDSAVVTNAAISSVLAMTPDEEGESQQSFDISALALIRLWKITAQRQSTSETEGQLDIAFLDTESCAGLCGSGTSLGTTGYMVGKTLVGSAGNIADVLKTTDGGGTWAGASAKPFAGGEAIACVLVFNTTGTTVRVLVARGTTDAGNPAEVAYSDNAGTSWTTKNVGSTNAQYMLGGNSLCLVSLYNLWAVTSGGYVYQSTDMGVTWTTKDAGVAASAANLNAIHFADSLVGLAGGATNTLIRTLDGGTTWAAITAPVAEAGNAINVVHCIDRNRAWIGYASGTIYYTLNLQDATPTWTARSLGITPVAVNDIKFVNSLVGFVAANTTGPVGHILRTWDGGSTWEDISAPTNAGLNALAPIDVNKVFAAGEAQGGTAVVIKVS